MVSKVNKYNKNTSRLVPDHGSIGVTVNKNNTSSNTEEDRTKVKTNPNISMLVPGLSLPKGGKRGDLLHKQSDNDGDVIWSSDDATIGYIDGGSF